jgi:hypothetical protein
LQSTVHGETKFGWRLRDPDDPDCTASSVLQAKARCCMKFGGAVLIVLAVAAAFAAREAAAIGETWPLDQVEHDYTMKRGETPWLGFVDGVNLLINPFEPSNPSGKYSHLYLGPLGKYSVPFSATQGLFGCCVGAAMLIALPTGLAIRSRRKREAS